MACSLSSLQRHALLLGMAFFVALSLHLVSPPLLCAENDDDLQSLLNNSESVAESERLLGLLEALKNNKILLNVADADELRQLPWLSSADVFAILRYRAEKGQILSNQTLETIIGQEKTASIAPYIRYKKEPLVRTSPTGKAVETEGSLYSRLFWEMPPRKGILNGKYAGGNYKLYHRAMFAAPHFSASLVQEKDVGEPDIADFSSLSLNAYELGVVQNAVVGNYRMTLGQGLLIGQGRYFSKGADPIGSVRLSSKPLLPYTSSSEYGFLRGAATTLRLAPFEATAFYSENPLDAVINSAGVITSFGTSGYHRTELEISRKGNVTETLSGANLRYQYHTDLLNAKVGGSVLRYRYPNPLDALEPIAALSTISAGTLYSIETALSAGKLNLFSETAVSQFPADVSWIAGAEYEVVRGLSMVVARRRYGVHYFSPFAGAFAERGDGAANEDGSYVGVQATLTESFSVAGYYDLFTFPQLGSHCPYPSHGNDARWFMNWKQTSWLGWNVQLQHKEKEEEKNQGTSKVALYSPLPFVTNRLQLDCNLALSDHLHLRTRGEVKSVVKQYLAGDQPFYGKLVYQQLGYSDTNYSVKARFTLFDTTDYDAAIYAYEDDLPLTSSLGVYDGRGKSLFLVGTWQVMRQMKLAARYETTWFDNRVVYSSGNDERATNAPSSFHLGCLLSF